MTKNRMLINILLLIGSNLSGLAMAQSTIDPDGHWRRAWAEGEKSCFTVKNGYGKETSRFCSVVVGADGPTVRMNHWTGNLQDETTATQKSTNEYRYDKNTGLYGSSGSSNLRFTPFETRGCLPVEPGRNCLQNISQPVDVKVESTQFPRWTDARLMEAFYHPEVEILKLEGVSEPVKVLRFTARFRRNDGGEYIREYLTRPDALYPVAERVWYKSQKVGVVEWATEVYGIYPK